MSGSHRTKNERTRLQIPNLVQKFELIIKIPYEVDVTKGT